MRVEVNIVCKSARGWDQQASGAISQVLEVREKEEPTWLPLKVVQKFHDKMWMRRACPSCGDGGFEVQWKGACKLENNRKRKITWSSIKHGRDTPLTRFSPHHPSGEKRPFPHTGGG